MYQPLARRVASYISNRYRPNPHTEDIYSLAYLGLYLALPNAPEGEGRVPWLVTAITRYVRDNLHSLTVVPVPKRSRNRGVTARVEEMPEGFDQPDKEDRYLEILATLTPDERFLALELESGKTQLAIASEAGVNERTIGRRTKKLKEKLCIYLT